jgi:hypothetical protein
MKALLTSILITLVPLVALAGGEKYSCNMMALTEDDRAAYQELAQTLLASVQETKELRNGYAFRLAPEMLVTAARWISFERMCCPFFAFELELAQDGGPLWLHITGSRGIKEFIRAEFQL